MSAYESFASVYDMFMDNIDYESWCRYLTGLLRKHGISDGLVCELGCGTGSMTELLAEAGYDMIGIDQSVEMLEVAQDKKYQSGHDILYLQQDMRAFELYGTVRAIVSVCDSMNYILTEEDLLKVFRLVNNYLDPGGLFVFDMNMAAKYCRIGDSTIAENRENGSFIWENHYDPKQCLNEYLLTLFIPEEEEKEETAPDIGQTGENDPDEEIDLDAEQGRLFRRYEEVHVQKAYPLETIVRLLREAGMIYEGAYEAFTDQAPDAQSGRICIVAREHGKSIQTGAQC
ncbi:MAG: class I SAM-dependent methyltransferase [Eubacterium sp.]|nr:class I SAM-dependent methyltransferase [Eubacterium sp.]